VRDVAAHRGYVLLQRGRLAEARAILEPLVERATATHNREGASFSSGVLFEVELELGAAMDAYEVMRRVGAGADGRDAFTKAFEARALLAAGKPRAAQATLDPAVPLFGPELDTTISLGIPTLVGTLAVHSAVGDVRAPDEARRLEAMLARAEELGSVPLAFRA